MDIHKLIEVLRATLVPDQSEKAEQQLHEVRLTAHTFSTWLPVKVFRLRMMFKATIKSIFSYQILIIY